PRPPGGRLSVGTCATHSGGAAIARRVFSPSLTGRFPSRERGGAGGNREVPLASPASGRRGSVGETWFPPRERDRVCRQRSRAKPDSAPQAWGERRSQACLYHRAGADVRATDAGERPPRAHRADAAGPVRVLL